MDWSVGGTQEAAVVLVDDDAGNQPYEDKSAPNVKEKWIVTLTSKASNGTYSIHGDKFRISESGFIDTSIGEIEGGLFIQMIKSQYHK